MKTKAKTPGKRIYPESTERGMLDAKPGEYFFAAEDGQHAFYNGWHGVTPTNLSCWLKNHHVEEHEDGTISVVHGPWGSNSILVNGGRPNEWHGEIQKGVWVEF